LGDEFGTERYEQWLSRGKPSTPSDIIDSIDPEKKQTVDSRAEGSTHSHSSENTSISGDSPSPTRTPEPFDSGADRDSTDSGIDLNGDGSLGGNDLGGSGIGSGIGSEGVSILLGVGNPKIESASNGVVSPSVEYLGGGGFNQIYVSGLYGDDDFFFMLDSGNIVDTDDNAIDAIQWRDLPEDGLIRFESNDGEYITVNLDADPIESDPSTQQTRAENIEDASREEPTQQNNLGNFVPSPIRELLLRIHRLEAPESLPARVGLFSIWAVIAVSPFLTSLGAIFWLLLVVPLRSFGPWALGAFTVYQIALSVFSMPLPTGNETIASVVGLLLISMGYMAFTTPNDS